MQLNKNFHQQFDRTFRDLEEEKLEYKHKLRDAMKTVQDIKKTINNIEKNEKKLLMAKNLLNDKRVRFGGKKSYKEDVKARFESKRSKGKNKKKNGKVGITQEIRKAMGKKKSISTKKLSEITNHSYHKVGAILYTLKRNKEAIQVSPGCFRLSKKGQSRL